MEVTLAARDSLDAMLAARKAHLPALSLSDDLGLDPHTLVVILERALAGSYKHPDNPNHIANLVSLADLADAASFIDHKIVGALSRQSRLKVGF